MSEVDGPLREQVQEITRAGERAATLTRQLLAFSRKQALQATVLNLNAIIGDVEKMVRRLLDESIEIRTVMEPALWPVKVDPAQFEQVLVNLVVNAGDAMPDGGVLAIETRNVEFRPPALAPVGPMLSPGPYVLLQVSDTGSGMDEATRAHIFEPFFTTKEQGKGTGLGLAMVYGIVQQSGGHILVDSAPGAGTTCRIYLPRAAPPARPAANVKDESAAQPLGGTETILLVEDERPVRFLARQALERHGYRVLEASSGEEACVMAEKHDGDRSPGDRRVDAGHEREAARHDSARPGPRSEDRVHFRVLQNGRGAAGIREGRGLLPEAVHRCGPRGRGAKSPRRPRRHGSGRRSPAAAPRRARLIPTVTRVSAAPPAPPASRANPGCGCRPRRCPGAGRRARAARRTC